MKNSKNNKPPMSRTDRLCLAALATTFLFPHLALGAIDSAALRAAEKCKPKAEIIVTVPTIDCTALVEAAAAIQADPYDESIPLDRELQTVLREACAANDVPLGLALGLIEVESAFQTDCISGKGCFGLFQLNQRYYPADLAPEENIQAGVEHLAAQLKRYKGDVPAALRAYNRGYDDGDRRYAKAVLDASEKWRYP